MNRRTFCYGVTGAVLTAAGSHAMAQGKAKRRVAVIGHTGRGNYGHGLDTVWLKLPDTQIVAVADANVGGLKKATNKLKVDGYLDYRKMLEKVDAEFVAVAPRHVDQHRDMAVAAIESGVRGIYIEKPFCRTPAEADEIIAACEKHGTKLAVAHRNRYHPALNVIDRLIGDGKLGELLEIRGRGKGDRRGGGEDLWVLGTHILNLTHYFGGEPRSCSALMRQNGKPVTKADVKDGREGLGPLAADELSRGVIGHYQSIANDKTRNAYAMQLIGSEGVVTIHIDRDPVAHFTPGYPFAPPGQPREWIPITSAGVGKKETQPDVIATVHNHARAVRDLIDAVDDARAPLCDAREGRTTVEMCCAVFDSHRQGGRAVAFPLKERDNPLRKL